MIIYKFTLILFSFAICQFAYANKLFTQIRSDYTSANYDNNSTRKDVSKFNLQYLRVNFMGETDKYKYHIALDGTRQLSEESSKKITSNLRDDIPYANVSLPLSANGDLSLTVGKQLNEYGSFEFEYGPINSYIASAMVRQADIYVTGAKVKWVGGKHTISLIGYNSNESTAADSVDQETRLAWTVFYRGTNKSSNFKPLASLSKNTPSGTDIEKTTLAIGLQGLFADLKLEFDYLNVNSKSASTVDSEITSMVFAIRKSFGAFHPFLKAIVDSHHVAGVKQYDRNTLSATLVYLPKNIKGVNYHFSLNSTNQKNSQDAGGKSSTGSTFTAGLTIMHDLLSR